MYNDGNLYIPKYINFPTIYIKLEINNRLHLSVSIENYLFKSILLRTHKYIKVIFI